MMKISKLMKKELKLLRALGIKKFSHMMFECIGAFSMAQFEMSNSKQQHLTQSGFLQLGLPACFYSLQSLAKIHFLIS